MAIGKAFKHSTINDRILKHYGSLDYLTIFLEDNPQIDSLTYLFEDGEEYTYRQNVGNPSVTAAIRNLSTEVIRSQTIGHVKIIPDEFVNRNPHNLKAQDYAFIQQNPEENYEEIDGVIQVKETTQERSQASLLSLSKRFLLDALRTHTEDIRSELFLC